VTANSRKFFESQPLQHIQVGDINVGYKTFGKGDPLFMIPAYSMTMDVWDPYFLSMLASYYKVIIFDNRGMGETTAGSKEFTIDQFADDTSGLITALGYKSSNVLGWSIGGDIVLSLVVNHPDSVKKVVVYAGDCGGTQKVNAPKYKDVLKDLSNVKGNMKMILGSLFPAWWIEADPDYWKQFPFPREKSDFANIKKQNDAYNVWAGVYDRLPDIKKPLLIVQGTEDVSTPPQNADLLAGRIPNAKLVMFPGAGHGLQYMYPIGEANVIITFLK
jgi:pimeloyl-ACP methyl ester carboxylesterase